MAIGIDLDGVVFPIVPAVCEFLNKKHLLNLKEEDFVNYNFWENLAYQINGVQATEQQAKDDFYEFIKTHEFRKIRPYSGAIKGVYELRKLDWIISVTSRQNELQNHTRWQLGYFAPKAFSDIVFGNHYSNNSSPSISKQQLCRDNNVCLLMEDNLDYALEVSQDIPVILFRKPYNEKFNTLEGSNIRIVPNWEEAVIAAKEIYAGKQ
jgi:uncharacterized HAD superfamily protein